ncbi:MAG: hypothetical protein JYX80_10665 [Candidatus Scalindua sediminis]|nr:hypothetical protein [Candidatus Scalindua sediminis]HDY68231.1 hypothetical protein [Candidatus Scalindua sp.]
MSDYIKNAEKYIQSIKEEFRLLNQYNKVIATMGFATFFAMAGFVKNDANKTIFIWSIIFMSFAVTLFVAHELFRMLYYSRYTSDKASAIEKLPDGNPLKAVDAIRDVVLHRMEKWNKWFLYPSLVSGFVAVILMFVNYFLILIS